MQINSDILKYDEKAAYSLRSLYRRFGYSHYRLSKFEEYSLYLKNKDFLVSDSIISFTDTKGRLLALKPDVTLSIINNLNDAAGHVHKLYYDENVYRMTKDSHTYKEIRQTGLECVGQVTFSHICEVIMLALSSLETISRDFIFEVSHVGVLETVFEEFNLSHKAEKRVLACINSKNSDELKQVCIEEDIPKEIRKKLAVFMHNFSSFEEAIGCLEELSSGSGSAAALEDFCRMLRFITQLGYEKHTKINFSLTNDMNYYSGVAFRGYVHGIPTGVLSGGAYDKLMKKMGKKSRAVGFAVYLDALSRLETEEDPYDVDILLIHDGDIAGAIIKARELSAEGQRVQLCQEIPQGIAYRSIYRYSNDKE